MSTLSTLLCIWQLPPLRQREQWRAWVVSQVLVLPGAQCESEIAKWNCLVHSAELWTKASPSRAQGPWTGTSIYDVAGQWCIQSQWWSTYELVSHLEAKGKALVNRGSSKWGTWCNVQLLGLAEWISYRLHMSEVGCCSMSFRCTGSMTWLIIGPYLTENGYRPLWWTPMWKVRFPVFHRFWSIE